MTLIIDSVCDARTCTHPSGNDTATPSLVSALIPSRSIVRGSLEDQ
jgi:hypothetical protein